MYRVVCALPLLPNISSTEGECLSLLFVGVFQVSSTVSGSKLLKDASFIERMNCNTFYHPPYRRHNLLLYPQIHKNRYERIFFKSTKNLNNFFYVVFCVILE